jgi:hypothetical protein
MNAVVRFVLGAFGGAILAYLGSQLFLLMTQSSDGAAILIKSHQQIEDESWQLFGPKILTVTIMGGLLGGATAAFLGASAATANRANRRHRSSHDSSTPLDRSEFLRVLASCAWIELRDKSPDYVQGVIVGRLAESDPALAQRVDHFDELEMDLLIARIRRHCNRITGTIGH